MTMPHLSVIDMARKPKKWIAGATASSHGQFRKKAEAAGESTREFAKKHEGDSGKSGKQARLAETLMGMHKKRRGSVLYDKRKD